MGVELEERIALERTLERDTYMVILEVDFRLDPYLPALSFECSSLLDDQSIEKLRCFHPDSGVS